ncbi:MAG TPA: zinc-ribbon domain-containing protein [Caulifigura sp.]|jgi:predicted Zn finger-like uncharacterized protein|nr:zinc-ribbon domain-containing protein [Caulifigura sp.]
MAPFKVSCEHCDASFKISDSSKIGKRVKCPKCAEPFTIRKPDAEDDEFDDDFDEEPVARPARRPAGKKAASKSKSSSDSNSTLIYIGGGAAAVVVIFGLMWLGGMFGGSTPPQPVAQKPAAPPADAVPIAALLDRLPPDTEVVMHFRIKDALASPLATGLRTPQFDAQLQSPNPLIPGTTASGINSLTVALANVTLSLSEQKRLGGAPGAARGPGALPIAMEPIVFVTLNDPLTPEFLNFPPESAIQHGSNTIYKRPGPAMPGTPPCLCIVEPKVVLLGTEPQVKAVLDQASPSGMAGDFNVVDGQSHVMLAICPRAIQQQIERLAINNMESPALHTQISQFASKGGKAMGVFLTLTSDLEGGVLLQASAAEKLADVQATLEEQVKSMHAAFQSPAMASNPMLAPLKPIVDAVKVTSAGDRVTASATVPKDTLVALGQSAMALAGPMMMQQMAPPQSAAP